MSQDIRPIIEQYISETGAARFEPRDGHMGVVFHDENEFIALTDLAYNSDLGFFKASRFPDAPRDAEYHEPQPASWKTLQFQAFDGTEDYTVYAIASDQDVKGFIVGEMEGVRRAAEAMSKLLETGQADEVVSEYDERLGYRWLSVTEAATKYNVPVSTVRRAADRKQIENAIQEGNEHRFPDASFRKWYSTVWRPRSKQQS